MNHSVTAGWFDILPSCVPDSRESESVITMYAQKLGGARNHSIEEPRDDGDNRALGHHNR